MRRRSRRDNIHSWELYIQRSICFFLSFEQWMTYVAHALSAADCTLDGIRQQAYRFSMYTAPEIKYREQ